MFCPFKFNPAYKDYIWGGRNLEKLGKKLPDGIVAESWEISCHPDGLSTIANGEFAGVTLNKLVQKYSRLIVGTALPDKDVERFPLLVKLIDANDKLSVQVHPEDEYAYTHENGELGKNEMWYIISAEPGAKLIYDVMPGITREKFAQLINDNNIESGMKYVDVFAGDILNIPAGLVHAIGQGIVLAEIQQNSNTTYRVYDYDRVDVKGNKRILHIDKALDVIDFGAENRTVKVEGIKVELSANSYKTYKIANKYFSLELYDIDGTVNEYADGAKFFIFICIKGEGSISYGEGAIEFNSGETLLIPASLGPYSLKGNFLALKTYVPDIEKDIIQPLMNYGNTRDDILAKVSGLGLSRSFK